jgi:hypothetical protein
VLLLGENTASFPILKPSSGDEICLPLEGWSGYIIFATEEPWPLKGLKTTLAGIFWLVRN